MGQAKKAISQLLRPEVHIAPDRGVQQLWAHLAWSCSAAPNFRVPWRKPPKGTSFKVIVHTALCVVVTHSK